MHGLPWRVERVNSTNTISAELKVEYLQSLDPEEKINLSKTENFGHPLSTLSRPCRQLTHPNEGRPDNQQL